MLFQTSLNRTYRASLFFAALILAVNVRASVLTYGDVDCLGFGCYAAIDPTTGATLQGLSNGVVTQSSNNFGHGFPFSSDAGDFAGTDQIYVGSGQTAAHDGYSTSSQRINGPDVLVMNYSPLVGPGQVVTSLTLGIAADDFQFPAFGQPYIVTLNGRAAPALTGALEALNETGPFVHFFTIGLSTSLDNPSHTLTLSIDEGGDGGDGWAIDFATVGVTTSSASGVPEPATVVLLGAGLAALCFRWGRRFACHGRG